MTNMQDALRIPAGRAGLKRDVAAERTRRDILQAATQEFHIDGTWTNPKITKLERKPPAAARAAEETGEK